MIETTLPAVPGMLSFEDPIAVLSAAGVIWHEPIVKNSVIYRVRLPLGWAKVRVQDIIFSLLDDKGRQRATTCESSQPFTTLLRRFRFVRDHKREKEKDPSEIVACVLGEGGIVIHTTQVFSVKNYMTEDDKHELRERVEDDAREWLEKYYPHWQDPGAYWS